MTSIHHEISTFSIKPEIDEIMRKPITFDILFNNSEHQATMLRYGVKKSEQVKHAVHNICR